MTNKLSIKFPTNVFGPVNPKERVSRIRNVFVFWAQGWIRRSLPGRSAQLLADVVYEKKKLVMNTLLGVEGKPKERHSPWSES
jgi:hypothetical protein